MRAAVLVLAALLAPAALAQDHAHETGDGTVWVLHDGPENGRAVVGGLTHFGFALVGPDGAPVVHRNANFTVEQNGRVLFATQDTHEYDGLFSFDVQFTRPGPYRVTAMSERMAVGVFDGEVVRAEELSSTRILLESVTATGAGVVSGRVSVVDEEGTLREHADLQVELRRVGDERLVSRFHLHIHDAPAEFTLSAPRGDYVLHVLGYEAFPTGRSGDIRPSVAQFPLSFGPLPTPALPAPPAPPALLRPSGASATADGFALHGTYDPQNQVGVGQAIRLAAAIVTDAGRPQAHVDFSFRLQGPTGLLFESKSLHEYDGVFEHLLVPDAPGQYDATLTADTGNATLTIPYQFHVLPPAAPIAGAGVGLVQVEGLEGATAGEPVELLFRVSGPQGPVQHSEVDVTLYHEDEAPAYQFKLHTHGSGETRAVVVFPHGADWTLRVDPLPTLPQAVVFQGPRGAGQPITFAVSVAAAASADAEDVDVPSPAAIPGAGVALALAACAIALALRTLPRRD